MDYDSLRSRFDNCEAKYLRRSVGNPLNECLAEILCVRPSDPIEYMGLWLYRYADIRNYFKKKKAFYQELLATKIDQDNKRMILIQKYNEAIIDITEPLVRPPPEADDDEPANETSATQSTTAQESENPKKGKSKTTVNENVTGPESDISDNSSLSRGLQPKFKDVSKKLQEMKTHSLKPRVSKTVTRTSAVYSSIGYDPPGKKSRARSTETEDDDDDDDDDDDEDVHSEKENLLNIHYFEVEGRRKSIEIATAKWKVFGHQVFCHHPILGTISMQKRRSSSGQPIESVPDFAAQSMYDPELYVLDNADEDLPLPATAKWKVFGHQVFSQHPFLETTRMQKRRFSSGQSSIHSETTESNIDEMDLKSTSDLGDLGTFFD